MDIVVKSAAPTRIDLAGGTLDVWPIPEILRSSEPANFFSLHGLSSEPHASRCVRTINAGIELFTSCTLRAKSRAATSANVSRGFVVSIGNAQSPEKYDLADQVQVASFCSMHPLIAKVTLHFAAWLAPEIESIAIETDSQIPKGSGLGGSSSLFVSLITAFKSLLKDQNDPCNNLTALCELACKLEAGMLGGLAGIQDHLGAAFGGVSAFELGAAEITRTAFDGSIAQWLENHAVLGLSIDEHHSGNTNWLVLKAFLSGENAARQAFSDLARNADKAFSALEKKDFKGLVESLSDDWKIRQHAFPFLTTEQIERTLATARAAGASGAKVCGAAAGGVMLITHDGSASQAENIKRAITSCGAQILPLKIATSGVKIQRSQ
jgi:D-glycero-alpha-D-manno-heptose-7-phosphate kinase